MKAKVFEWDWGYKPPCVDMSEFMEGMISPYLFNVDSEDEANIMYVVVSDENMTEEQIQELYKKHLDDN